MAEPMVARLAVVQYIAAAHAARPSAPTPDTPMARFTARGKAPKRDRRRRAVA